MQATVALAQRRQNLDPNDPGAKEYVPAVATLRDRLQKLLTDTTAPFVSTTKNLPALLEAGVQPTSLQAIEQVVPMDLEKYAGLLAVKLAGDEEKTATRVKELVLAAADLQVGENLKAELDLCPVLSTRGTLQNAVFAFSRRVGEIRVSYCRTGLIFQQADQKVVRRFWEPAKLQGYLRHQACEPVLASLDNLEEIAMSPPTHFPGARLGASPRALPGTTPPPRAASPPPALMASGVVNARDENSSVADTAGPRRTQSPSPESQDRREPATPAVVKSSGMSGTGVTPPSRASGSPPPNSSGRSGSPPPDFGTPPPGVDDEAPVFVQRKGNGTGSNAASSGTGTKPKAKARGSSSQASSTGRQPSPPASGIGSNGSGGSGRPRPKSGGPPKKRRPSPQASEGEPGASDRGSEASSRLQASSSRADSAASLSRRKSGQSNVRSIAEEEA